MAVNLTSPRPAHGALNYDSILEADFAEIATKANGVDFGVPSSDWNLLTKSGAYYASTTTNSPNGSANGFFVYDMHRSDGAGAAQIAVNVNGDLMYFRRYINSAWQPWRTLVHSGGDTGWVTTATGITAASGWTLNSSKYRNNNGVVSIQFNCTRSGAALPAFSTAGTFTPNQIVLLPSTIVPAQSNGLLSAAGGNSTIQASGYAASAGNVTITQGTPGQTIGTNAVVEMVGTYLL